MYHRPRDSVNSEIILAGSFIEVAKKTIPAGGKPAFWPDSPIGRGIGFKIRTVWVRVPLWLL